MNWKRWLLLLLPGGSLLTLLVMMTGIGMPAHSGNITDGVNIFSKVPYKEQLFRKKHPGECYDSGNTYDNGDKIKDSPSYGPCSKNAMKKHKEHTIPFAQYE